MTRFLKPSATVELPGQVAPVAISEGEASLDASRVPYASTDCTVVLSDIDDVDDLDPRLGVRGTLNITEAVAGVTREFDLSIRSRVINRLDRTVTIHMESDEALLQSYRPLTDNRTPLTFQSSLRALVNYVLGVVIPGATLEPGTDVAIPALSASQNLIRNPRVANNTTDWAATWSTGGLTTGRFATGGPTHAPSRWYMQANTNTTGAYTYITDTAVSITPGKQYMLSVDTRSATGVQLSIDAWQIDSAGSIVGVVTPVLRTSVAGTYFRDSMVFTALDTASRLRPRVSVVGTLASGAAVEVTGFRLSEYSGDPSDVAYFDGDTTDTAQYNYAWPPNAAAHASPATRTVLIDAATPDALVWKAGTSAWDFLEPLTARTTMRLFCDEVRDWRLIDPGAYTIPTLVALSGLNSTDGADTITTGNPDLYATGVIVNYKWTGDADGIQYERSDTAGLPGIVRVVELNRPYPGPGVAAAILSRMDGRGRIQDVTAVSDYTVTPAMRAQINLPGTDEQTGDVAFVTWSLTDALMSVGTLDLIDIIPGSVEALLGTVDALVGTVDSL